MTQSWVQWSAGLELLRSTGIISFKWSFESFQHLARLLGEINYKIISKYTPFVLVVQTLCLFSQGIGDLGQGFANFLLFCFLTDKFQVRFKKLLRSQCCHRFRGSKQNPHQRQVVQSRVTKPSAAQPIRKQTSKNLAGCNETSPLLQGSNTNTASPPRSP